MRGPRRLRGRLCPSNHPQIQELVQATVEHVKVEAMQLQETDEALCSVKRASVYTFAATRCMKRHDRDTAELARGGLVVNLRSGPFYPITNATIEALRVYDKVPWTDQQTKAVAAYAMWRSCQELRKRGAQELKNAVDMMQERNPDDAATARMAARAQRIYQEAMKDDGV